MLRKMIQVVYLFLLLVFLDLAYDYSLLKNQRSWQAREAAFKCKDTMPAHPTMMIMCSATGKILMHSNCASQRLILKEARAVKRRNLDAAELNT